MACDFIIRESLAGLPMPMMMDMEMFYRARTAGGERT